jgi:hypothetical protein
MADSISAAREAAGRREDGSAERRLLSQGEALAESIRVVTGAALSQRITCAPLAESLRVELDRVLAAGVVPGGFPGPDSLLALRGRLLRQEVPAEVTNFALPEIGPTDPPELLRQKSAYARDLIDRADRWLAATRSEAERLRQQRRIREEASQLRRDEGFFDEGAGLETPAWDDEGPAEAMEIAESSEWGRLLQGLMGVVPGGEDPSLEAALERLESWLLERRGAALRRAEELTTEAEHREREL